MALPYFYQQMNLIMGTTVPSEIEYMSDSYFYFWRSLYQRLRSKLDVSVPVGWEKEPIVFLLLGNGFLPVIDTNKYGRRKIDKVGVIPLYGNPGGVGAWNQPVKAVFQNPIIHLRKSEFTLWEECGAIILTPDYSGVFDIIDKYAKTLSTLDSTLNQSIINARVAYVFAAKNQAGAQTIKAVMDERNKGNPYIVYDADMFKDEKHDKADFLLDDDMFTFVDFQVKENYITDKLLHDTETVYHQFDNEVGIPSNPQEKKERMVTNEIESNNVETVARFTTWMECLDDSIEKTKRLYPGEIDDFSIKPKQYDTGQTGAVETGKVGDRDASQSNIDRDE